MSRGRLERAESVRYSSNRVKEDDAAGGSCENRLKDYKQKVSTLPTVIVRVEGVNFRNFDIVTSDYPPAPI